MRNEIIQGDVIDVLPALPPQSVNCIITSPPYFGLRDYGLPPTNWPAVEYSPMAGLPALSIPAMSTCLGLEDSIEAYVGHLVYVFRLLGEVLRDDGVAWLNLGDSYAGSQMRGGMDSKEGIGKLKDRMFDRPKIALDLKPKDLMGIPWRVAFALQADGWFLRSDVIWDKVNPLPESVRDRPTKAHEYLFLLAKNGKYWYDQDAIREHGVMNEGENRKGSLGRGPIKEATGLIAGHNHCGNGYISSGSRNKRSVWRISSTPFPAAHFAVMPPKLVEPCLLAGCPGKVCVECGEPWVRMVERELINTEGWGKTIKDHHTHSQSSARNGQGRMGDGKIKTIGFAPTCQCNGHFEDEIIKDYYDYGDNRDKVISVYVPHIPLNEHPTRPGLVLDPFAGAGTVAKVAIENKRDWLGIDLNPEYVEMANKRLEGTNLALFGRELA